MNQASEGTRDDDADDARVSKRRHIFILSPGPFLTCVVIYKFQGNPVSSDSLCFHFVFIS